MMRAPQLLQDLHLWSHLYSPSLIQGPKHSPEAGNSPKRFVNFGLDLSLMLWSALPAAGKFWVTLTGSSHTSPGRLQSRPPDQCACHCSARWHWWWCFP